MADLNNKYLSQLIITLQNKRTTEEIEEFLESILTIKELIEISTRLEIVKQLKLGIPQQKIAKDLGVGVATITRGAHELKLGHFRDV